MPRLLSDDLPRARLPVLTYALMAMWVVVWVIQLLRPDDGDVDDSGQAIACRWGMVPVHVVKGASASGSDPCVALSAEHSAWLEVLTAQFLHASWWHLVGNLVFIWVFAPAVEERLGRVRFLPFVLACGYVAFLAEALASASSASPVLGGSGIVAGVLGAYVVLFPKARLRIIGGEGRGGIPAWITIIAWIAYETLSALGGASSDTAHWVHVTGFALGALFARPAAAGRTAESRPLPQWVRVAIARNQPEAEMIQGILADSGVPSFVRRMAGFDVPDFLAGGPRDIMVPADRALEAHAVIDPLEPAGGPAPAD